MFTELSVTDIADLLTLADSLRHSTSNGTVTSGKKFPPLPYWQSC